MPVTGTIVFAIDTATRYTELEFVDLDATSGFEETDVWIVGDATRCDFISWFRGYFVDSLTSALDEQLAAAIGGFTCRACETEANCPSDATAWKKWESSEYGNYATHNYYGVMGTSRFANDGVLHANSKVAIGAVVDGLTYTIGLGERPNVDDLLFGWWCCGAGRDSTGVGGNGNAGRSRAASARLVA